MLSRISEPAHLWTEFGNPAWKAGRATDAAGDRCRAGKSGGQIRWADAQEGEKALPFDIAEALNRAIQDHQAGRAAAAAAAYRSILAVEPANVPALHLLGVAERRLGNSLTALYLILRSRFLNPAQHGLEVNLDNALVQALDGLSDRVQAGFIDEAAAALQRIVAMAPPHPGVLRNYGTVRCMQGRLEEADRLCREADALEGQPNESGLRTALGSIGRHAVRYGFAGTVVIPAFRAAAYIRTGLDSILAAVEYARRVRNDPSFKVHISVVDDCSPDDTADVVRAWAAAHPDQSLSLLVNNQNRGAGRARNAGAANAFGPYLWFLDADDHYFENHLHLTARALDERPAVGYVRTGMHFDEFDGQVSPEWRHASEFTYPCNICVRRVCHDLVGGFPDEDAFGPAGPEDVAYSRALGSLFLCGKTAVQTVYYTMREGNILEKLHKEMLGGRPPGEGFDIRPRDIAVEILIQRRLYALEAKRTLGWQAPLIKPDRVMRIFHF